MRAVYKQPGALPEVMDIDNDLVPIQAIVGGYIETVSLGDGLLLIVNEEGKLLGLDPNMYLVSGAYVDEIVGPALVVKDAGEEFGELTEEEADEVCRQIGGSGIWLLK